MFFYLITLLLAAELGDWKPIPREGQAKYQEEEMAAFIHFSINTFTGKEWGTGSEDPNTFNPTAIDTDQWVTAIKNAGYKRIIFTAKHHDGFCTFDSKYTGHSVKSSTNFKKTQSAKSQSYDVLELLSKSCTKLNMNMGVYLSPWDMNNPAYGKETEYNNFYINQLTELLNSSKYGNNGKFVEVWMDGAKGEGAKDMKYHFDDWFKLIYKLQPGCEIFSSVNSGIRWIGNENGRAGDPCWSKINGSKLLPDTNIPNDYLNHGDIKGADYSIGECDVSIADKGWFWNSKTGPRTLEELTSIYLDSVGHGQPLFLNFPPNTTGLIPEKIISRANELKKGIDGTFATNLAASNDVVITPSATSATYKINDIKIDNKNFFASDGDSKTLTLTIDLKSNKEFDVVTLSEPIRKGQRIISGNVEYLSNNVWTSFGTFNTVGSKRIIRGKKVIGSKIRINIQKSQAKPAIRHVGVYKAAGSFSSSDTNYYQGLEFIDAKDAKQMGTWTVNGNSLTTNDPKNKLVFTFTGSRVWVIGKRNTGYGGMNVSIDDTISYWKVSTSDTSLKADTLLMKTKYVAYGPHTITINPSAASNKIDIQGIYYLGTNKGMFEIAKQKYLVNAGEPITLSVKRFGSAVGKASVSFFTDPNSAVQGKNYQDTQGTLTFADGEIIKTITVSTINSSSQNGDLSFFIKIANPTDGAIVGYNSTATVTIKPFEIFTIDSASQTLTINVPMELTQTFNNSVPNYKQIKKIVFCDGCKIMRHAFDGLATEGWPSWSSLEDVVLPDSIDLIDAFAFRSNKFETFRFPKSVTVVGQSVLASCASLQRVYIPGNITAINGYAFNGIAVNIYYFGYTAPTIKDTAFNNNKLPNVYLNSGVTFSKGTKYFKYSFKTTNLNIKVIDDQVLEISAIPKTKVELDFNEIQTGLSNNKIISKFTELRIKSGSFNLVRKKWDQQNFSRVIFFDVNDTQITQQAFSHNDFIEEVEISKGVTSLGNSVFDTCSNLKKVRISGDISFGDWVFHKCYSLQEVVYCGLDQPTPGPQNHIFTGDFAGSTYEYGDDQVNLYVPNSFKDDHFVEMRFIQKFNHVEVQNHIFDFSDASTNITGDGDVSSDLLDAAMQSQKCGNPISGNFMFIGKDVNVKAFNDYKIIESIKFSVSGTLTISEKCFSGCSNLNSIELPLNLISLELDAFKGTAIKTITIPSSCKTISNSVFSNCKQLTSVTFDSNIDKMGNYVFHNCLKLVNVIYKSDLPPVPLNQGSLVIFTYDIPTKIKADSFGHYDSNVTVHVQYDYSGASFGEKLVKRDLNVITLSNFIIRMTGDTLIIEAKYNRSIVAKNLIDQVYNKLPALGYSTSNIRNFVFRGKDMNVSKDGFKSDKRLINVEFQNTGKSVLLNKSFFNCTNLVSITLPPKLINLSDSALKMSNIEKITIPSYCRVIENACFNDCFKLKEVNIMGDLDYLGNYIFHNDNNNLKTLTYCGTRAPKSLSKDGFIIFSYDSTDAAGNHVNLPFWGNLILNVPSDYEADSFAESNYLKRTDSHYTINGFEFRYEGTELKIKSTTTSTSLSWSTVLSGINTKSFCSCTLDKITKLIIQGNVVNIPDSGFSDSTIPIKSIEFQTSGKSTIGNKAFNGYESLENIKLPLNLVSLGDSVFSGSGIINIEVPANCTTVGANCFSSCSKLVKAHFVGSVTSIGNNCFSNCAKLMNVTYCGFNKPSGNTFFTNNTNVYVSVPTDYKEAKFGELSVHKFENKISNDDFTFQFVAGTLVITAKKDTTIDIGSLSVINTENPCGCKSIDLQSILIVGTNSLTVNTNGFKNHEHLESIEFLNTGNTIIKAQGFYNCSKLSSITLPENLQSLGDSSIKMTSIQVISIPSKCTTIGQSCFDSCNQLESIRITSNLNSIGSYAFHNCLKLSSLVYCGTTQPTYDSSIGIFTSDHGSIANNVEVRVTDKYQSNSFAEKTHLLKAGQFSHDDEFTYLFNGTTVNINGSGTLTYSKIVNAMSSGVCGSESINFKNIIVSGGDITIDSKGFSVADNLNKGNAIQNFEFRNSGSTNIGERAFNQLNTLSSVVFNKGLKYINNSAFKGTNLTDIIVPSCDLIDESAFAKDGSITYDKYSRGIVTIQFEGNVQQIGRWTFDGNTNLTRVAYCGDTNPVKVPANSKEPVFSNTNNAFTVSMTEIYKSPKEFVGVPSNQIVIKHNIQTHGNFNYTISGSTLKIKSLKSDTIKWATVKSAYSPENYPCGCTIDDIDAILFEGGDITIPDSGFKDLPGITVVHFKNTGKTIINSQAFKNCSSLAEVNFNYEVTSIGDWVFHNDLKLTTIFYCGSKQPKTLGNDKKIFTYDLVVAGKITNGHYQDNVTIYVRNTYIDNSFVEKNELKKGSNFIDYKGFISVFTSNYVEIKGTGNITASHISRNYCKCAGTIDDTHATIVIKGGDINISDNTFAGDNTIQTLRFENEGKTIIGNGAFSKCTNLAAITFNSQLSIIGPQCFKQVAIKSINFPSCDFIMDSSFDSCSSLQSVSFAGDVKKFGNWIFNNCLKLTRVSYCGSIVPLLQSSSSDDFMIFTYASNNKQVSYKRNITLVVSSDYTGTKFAELDKSEFKQESDRFTDNGIEYYIYNQTVEINLNLQESISWSAFEKSISLMKPCSGVSNKIEHLIILGQAITILQDGFSQNQQLKTVEFKSTGNMIVQLRAFYNCTNLTSIIFPPGLQGLGQQAFQSSGVKSISLPAFCHYINDSCFANCKEIESVSIDGNIDYIGNYVFHNCLKLTKLVYCGSVVPTPLHPSDPSIFTYDLFHPNGSQYNGNFMKNVTVTVTNSYTGSEFVGKTPLIKADTQTQNDGFKFSFLGS